MAALAPTPEWGGPRLDRLTWRQLRDVRLVAGLVTMLGLMSLMLVPDPVRWQIGSFTLELQPWRAQLYLAVLLVPFLRQVSYRKRDALLIGLVPFWGAYLAAEIVWRLLCLPRRDWVPRYDELPRVVRIPHGRGDYLLLPTFQDAEALRSAWCVNSEHHHPYPTWTDARVAGCAGRTAGISA